MKREYGLMRAVNPQDLEIKVQVRLDEGWMCLGGPITSQHQTNTDGYYQAVVRDTMEQPQPATKPAPFEQAASERPLGESIKGPFSTNAAYVKADAIPSPRPSPASSEPHPESSGPA